MLPFITGFFWLLLVFAMLYMVVIFLITFGWLRIKQFYHKVNTPLPEISIVVAVRNESMHIERLLKAIALQDYPGDKYEVVIVNDHSEDDTYKLVTRFNDKHKTINIRLLEAETEGKKAAVKTGIDKARYELIVTTDGDCTMGPNWLQGLAAYYEVKKPKMIVGPVVYTEEKGLLRHFFMLDFMSLVASGAGSLGLGLPLMANGANLMFAKETYQKMVARQDGKTKASGDDVFLLHAVARLWGAKQIHFIKAPHTLVETTPPENMKHFLQQRIRWSSKATAYRSWWAVFVSLTVFLFNLLLVLSLLAVILRAWFVVIYLLFSLLKMIIDFPLLRHFSEFAGRKKSLYYLFLFGWIYPVYIVFAALYSFVSPFSWKGREGLK